MTHLEALQNGQAGELIVSYGDDGGEGFNGNLTDAIVEEITG